MKKLVSQYKMARNTVSAYVPGCGCNCPCPKCYPEIPYASTAEMSAGSKSAPYTNDYNANWSASAFVGK